MSAQALSQVTFRRTRLLYIPIKKMMIRTSAIKIIQAIISDLTPEESVNDAGKPNIRVYVRHCKERWSVLMYPGHYAPNCYLWRIVEHWFMLRAAFAPSLSYALQDAQRFRVRHRRLSGRSRGGCGLSAHAGF